MWFARRAVAQRRRVVLAHGPALRVTANGKQQMAKAFSVALYH